MEMFRQSNEAGGAAQLSGSGSGSISKRPGSGSVPSCHGTATLYNVLNIRVQIKKCSDSQIKRVARHKYQDPDLDLDPQHCIYK
jgi:hypothetical protein